MNTSDLSSSALWLFRIQVVSGHYEFNVLLLGRPPAAASDGLAASKILPRAFGRHIQHTPHHFEATVHIYALLSICRYTVTPL